MELSIFRLETCTEWDVASERMPLLCHMSMTFPDRKPNNITHDFHYNFITTIFMNIIIFVADSNDEEKSNSNVWNTLRTQNNRIEFVEMSKNY